LREFYREQLQGANAVIVGGGNLFSDVDLNFPAKLDAALSIVAEKSLPVWIYGCGVSETWSDEGRQLFERALSAAQLVDVFVRDGTSKRLWDERLSKLTGHPAKVVLDPGLLAACVYGVSANESDIRGRVGVGIIAPIAISYHSGRAPVPADALLQWFSQLIEGLAATGRSVTLISNGSPEDTRFGTMLMASIKSRLPEAKVDFPLHREPSDLVRTFATISAYVGFRLHGLICACSFGIPTFALDWDRKVIAFMDSIGRGDCRFDVAIHPSDVVLARILNDHSPACLDGPKADQGIAELCKSIASVVRATA
jgi:polysaccharide pyruvyl transferase WcaK-like protein